MLINSKLIFAITIYTNIVGHKLQKQNVLDLGKEWKQKGNSERTQNSFRGPL